ncbi:MAG: aldehyde dehydrogenase (NAD+) [Planctomycetota bacterium]|jgi:aldehyde dehydrogenase (NAD+)
MEKTSTVITQSKNDSNERILSIFENQKQNLKSLKSSSIKERKKKLVSLKKAIFSHRAHLQKAIYLDFKKPNVETDISEIYPVIVELKHTISQISYWAQDMEVETPITLLGSSSFVKYEPKGNTLIITPWNYPIFLSLSPIISAISAGNAVILKPSEFTPYTNIALKNLLLDVFKENEVAVIEGDYTVSGELLKLKFNHIHFTGSPAVGKVIMRAAADHLSSCTLELGGKSPSIVDETANLKEAATKIVWGKYLNEGQTCIAPDYILIHESVKEKFIALVKAEIENKYGDTDLKRIESNNLCRIINDKNYDRLKTLIKNTKSNNGKIEYGATFDDNERYISPTIISDVSLEDDIMNEEIFGPIMPIVSFKKMEEAIDLINSKEKPLALYIFSKKKKNINQVLNETSSGGVCINEVLLHITNPNLPFGGVNNSGIGKSHGKWGFIDFSNEKAVLKQHVPFGASQLLYPPYSKLTKIIIDLTMKWF